jgi:hypothetical protein
MQATFSIRVKVVVKLAKSAVLSCHQSAWNANGHHCLNIRCINTFAILNISAPTSHTMSMIMKINLISFAKTVIIRVKIALDLIKISAQTAAKTMFVVQLKTESQILVLVLVLVLLQIQTDNVYNVV